MSESWNDIVVRPHDSGDGTWRAEAPNGVFAYSGDEQGARERCIYMLGLKDGSTATMRAYFDKDNEHIRAAARGRTDGGAG